MQKIDLSGQHYHGFTVLYRASDIPRQSRWVCKCECGNTMLVTQRQLRWKKSEVPRCAGCNKSQS
jgi:hypothetical protein